MLKAIVPCLWKLMNQPVRLIHAHFLIHVFPGQAVHNLKQREIRLCGIDIARGQAPLYVFPEPVLKKFHITFITILFIQHIQAVKSHALGPVPFLNPKIPCHISSGNGFLYGNVFILVVVRAAQVQKFIGHLVCLRFQSFCCHYLFLLR